MTISLPLAVLLMLAGFGVLVLGGEGTVQGSLSLARRLRLNHAVIGVLIIGFGTSSPELLLCLQSAWKGSSGFALGNILGSNMANLLLIGGMILFCSRSADREQAVSLHSIVAALSLLSLAVFVPLGVIGLWGGALLLLPFLVYSWLAVKSAHKIEKKHYPPIPGGFKNSLGYGVLMVLGGLVAMIVGAELIVEGGQTIARAMGISETIIGLSVLALGTSLPELAATFAAVRRKDVALAASGIFGSTIFNDWLILPLSALILPLPLGEGKFDILAAPPIFVLLLLGLRSSRRVRLFLAVSAVLSYGGYWLLFSVRI